MEKIIHSGPPLKNQGADRVLRTFRSTTEKKSLIFVSKPFLMKLNTDPLLCYLINVHKHNFGNIPFKVFLKILDFYFSDQYYASHSQLKIQEHVSKFSKKSQITKIDSKDIY